MSWIERARLAPETQDHLETAASYGCNMIRATLSLTQLAPKLARRLFETGVIVNDSPHTLVSALAFGTNFIHVGSPTELGMVADLLLP